jgi:hypothetical protein
VPEFFHLEVNTTWVLRILLPLAVIFGLSILVLWLRLDDTPHPGPSLASLRNLRTTVTTLRDAREALRRGDAAAAEAAAMKALDQAPASTAARQIVVAARSLLIAEEASAEARHRVAEIVAEGRDLYHRGEYRNAAEQFREALEIEPEHEIAASFLELSEERLRAQARRSSSSRSSRTSPIARRPTPVAKPTPGTAQITVNFNSPINSGTLLITFDGETLADIPFDFTKKGFLGIKRGGQGQVKRVLLTPSGRHTVAVELTDRERGPMGVKSFVKVLQPGSRWTLRIDLPAGASQANFYLVESKL